MISHDSTEAAARGSVPAPGSPGRAGAWPACGRPIWSWDLVAPDYIPTTPAGGDGQVARAGERKAKKAPAESWGHILPDGRGVGETRGTAWLGFNVPTDIRFRKNRDLTELPRPVVAHRDLFEVMQLCPVGRGTAGGRQVVGGPRLVHQPQNRQSALGFDPRHPARPR